MQELFIYSVHYHKTENKVKMKILYSGYHNPDFITITEYVERAILQLGYELETYDYRQHIIPYRISEILPFLYRWDMNKLNIGLIKCVDSFKPDILLVNWGHILSSNNH